MNNMNSFCPYLKDVDNGFRYYGIGEKTNLTDSGYNALYIGDLVDIYDIETRIILATGVVVKDEYEDFVIIYEGPDAYFPLISVKKIKSYEELKHGERICGIEVVLEDEQ